MDYAVGTCDDLAADRDHLAALVRQWAARAGHTVKIAAFFLAENFLFHYAEEAAYDILLLDIEMEAMDGVSLAKKIRQKDDTVQIVFITGYCDYIAEGYEVAALHYLMKPVKKDAPFIILDEPTAALDPIAEAEIYEKFDAIAGDKTAIYISHRLSSCKFCDEIAVFHGGAVIQQGTHAQLLADESGKYHELWMAQAQYYVQSAES